MWSGVSLVIRSSLALVIGLTDMVPQQVLAIVLKVVVWYRTVWYTIRNEPAFNNFEVIVQYQ